MNNYYLREEDMYRRQQEHVHEYYGSTYVAEAGKEAHTHRLAGVSSEAMPVSGGHVHEITGMTTFNDGHIHRFRMRTGMQIPVGANKHVHFVTGVTTLDDGHTHKFEFTTSNE